MIVELISMLPPWVFAGLLLGGIASALVAIAFYLGNRFAPPSVAEAEAAGDAGRRVAGDERRRREIREYLTATGERFRENHALDDVAVPFYLPEREVAITFNAHDYFHLEGEGIYTVLCEHEMPGRGLGRRLPFDVTEPDWGPHRSAGGDRDPVAAAFAELDVSTDADAAEVKSAYRERVKETHPDQGGDEVSFRRVREAYATARNHAGDGAGRESRDGRGDPPHRTDREPATGYRR